MGSSIIKRLAVCAVVVMMGTGLLASVAFGAKTPLEIMGAKAYEPGTEAPDFTLQTLEGKKGRLQDLRGRFVFLNFWATWCIDCRKEMPAMEKLNRELAGLPFAMVAVNVQETPKQAEAFRKELGFTYPVWLDPKGEVGLLYGAWGLPNTYLIGPNGDVVGRVIGPRSWSAPEVVQAMKDLIQGTLRSPPQPKR